MSDTMLLPIPLSKWPSASGGEKKKINRNDKRRHLTSNQQIHCCLPSTEILHKLGDKVTKGENEGQKNQET